jgi:Holliday junction resolvase
VSEKILESKVQEKIVKRYKKEGWTVVKIILCSLSGFPDLMCLRDGMALFIEVKRPGERPRPLQIFVHDMLRRCGFEVLVLDE